MKINPSNYYNMHRIFLSFLLFIGLNNGYGQNNSFDFQRDLPKLSHTWGKIIFPNDLYQHLNPNLSDIRIYSFSNIDTIEAPYILKISSKESKWSEVAFKMLNTTHDSKNYYYTFQINESQTINEVKLNMGVANFDWLIQWEGSNDLQNWFTILEDYRILGLVNNLTEYTHTNLTFPNAQYKYYRLIIPTVINPQLNTAKVKLRNSKPAQYISFKVLKMKETLNKTLKESSLELILENKVPVSYVKIYSKNKIAYCRNVLIETQSDSIKTPQGWMPYFDYMAGGVLNSNTKNEFTFDGKIVKKIKISIQNKDNIPLQIDSVEVKGFTHELQIRFPDTTRKYTMVYGNKKSNIPQYDLAMNMDNIPLNIPTLFLGKEILLTKETISKNTALFEKPIYLWIIIILIIVLLGFFSYKMLQSKNE